MLPCYRCKVVDQLLHNLSHKQLHIKRRRVRAELARCFFRFWETSTLATSSVEPQRAGKWRNQLSPTFTTLGPNSPDLSRIFPNSWRSSSPASKFRADYTYFKADNSSRKSDSAEVMSVKLFQGAEGLSRSTGYPEILISLETILSLPKSGLRKFS